ELNVAWKPVINGPPHLEAYETVPFSYFFAANHSIGEVKWDLWGGLPQGLRLVDQTLIGTPVESGEYRFTVRATESEGAFGESRFVILINPAPSIVTSEIPVARATVPYEAHLDVEGGAANWVAGRRLPAGLQVLRDGMLVGRPAEPGSFDFTVSAVDEKSAKTTIRLHLDVEPGVKLGNLVPDLRQTVPVAHHFNVDGARGEVIWTMKGDLPEGLTFSSGVLSGTPVDSGAFSATIRATDREGAFDEEEIQMFVVRAPSIANANLPSARQAEPYLARLRTRGTVEQVSWTVEGRLPPGLTVGDNKISGVPRQAGRWTFLLICTDGEMARGGRELEIVVHEGW
ncbi:MAG: hypothetical protein HN348_24940, partial [Proteobacteria bacterium]|nr:hypothetical protein [Pseudomonadota bacterium]